MVDYKLYLKKILGLLLAPPLLHLQQLPLDPSPTSLDTLVASVVKMVILSFSHLVINYCEVGCLSKELVSSGRFKVIPSERQR